MRNLIAAYALASTWAQQTNTTAAPSALEQCAMQKGCSLNDLDCRAACAGVPNPSTMQVNATNNCVAACNQTNVQEYALCTQNCINNNFNQAAPSTNTTTAGHAKNITAKNATNSSAAVSHSQAAALTHVGASMLLLAAGLFVAISSV